VSRGVGLTDIHAHPAMNAFLWDRDLRRHYGTGGGAFNPLASLSDFPMLTRGGVRVLWSALHVPEKEFLSVLPIRLLARTTSGGRMLLARNAWECLLAMHAEMERQVARADARFVVVTSNAELDAAVAADRVAILHTVEGGHVLGAGLDADDVHGRLVRVDELAERGVASMTLAHLFPNELAGHADGIPASPFRRLLPDARVDLSRGLSDVGRAVVERMVARRMVVDVAHCTAVARAEVYDLVGGRAPVIATHVGLRELNPSAPYDLDESDVRAIAASSGVVGVIFMPYWLDARHPKNGLDAIWRTMERVREWTGSWDHLAIGTDFDGFTDPPDDCRSAGELPRVRDMLADRGLSDSDLDAVLGGNARRVLRDGWR
jgi:microsomal dipeptidase-like Zn-dependent dipeptidase